MTDVTTHETTFDDAVAAVRAGGSPDEQARTLYAQLSDDERLGLLDGDEEFWPGMQQMIEAGYNLRPYVHGAVQRLEDKVQELRDDLPGEVEVPQP